MKFEHERWIAEALRLGSMKRFDEAYRLVSLVICEDAKNVKALWILATTTTLLNERRWALRTILRLEPDCFHAHQLLNATEHKLAMYDPQYNMPIRPIEKITVPPYLAH